METSISTFQATLGQTTHVHRDEGGAPRSPRHAWSAGLSISGWWETRELGLKRTCEGRKKVVRGWLGWLFLEIKLGEASLSVLARLCS